MPPSPSPTPTYHPSFSYPDTNIVLRSSDGTLFRVYPLTLRTTCGFFHDMLTLPQPDNHSASDQTIQMEEDGRLLELFLRIISCLEIPRWTSRHDVQDILRIAEKYDSPGTLSVVRLAIESPLFRKHPLEKYAIAWKFGWREEAKLAASSSLALSIFDQSHYDVLKSIPSKGLLDLISLHNGRKEGFKQAMLSLSGDDLFQSWNTVCVSSCGHGNREKALAARFQSRMLLEFDRRPLGDTLLEPSVLDGPEATACWLYRCPHCARSPFTKENVREKLTTFLKQLPVQWYGL